MDVLARHLPALAVACARLHFCSEGASQEFSLLVVHFFVLRAFIDRQKLLIAGALEVNLLS